MGSEDMEEKDMAPAVTAEEAAAAPGEEGAVKWEERVGEEEGALLGKRAPNDELNSKIAHDGVSGDVDESVVAVAGSVVESVEAPVSAGAELDAVSASVDPEPAPSGDVVDATEKVESWDLSEAVAKSVQDDDEKEDLKSKISEEGSPEGVDTEDTPVVSIGSIEDSVGGEPMSVSSDVEDKAGDSEHAGDVTEIPLQIAGGEDVSPEFPAEKVEGEAVGAPMEEVNEVVEASNSVEPDEGSASLEAVPSPSDDVEEKSVEVNSKDVSEVASILPSGSVDNEGDSSGSPAERPCENVDSEALEAPVDSGKLDAQVVHEVVEPKTSAEANEESAEPESVSAPADDVEEKSVEVNSEDTREANTVMPSESAENDDVSPELPAGGPSANVDSEALEAPVDGAVLVSEVVHEVVEPTTSAEADEGSAEPESVSAPDDNVEEKSVEVNSEDFSEAAVAEADEGSAEPESVSAPSVDVEDKSIEVNTEDTSEAVTAFPSESAENEDVSPELPAEGPSGIVDSKALDTPADREALVPEVDDEVVEQTSSGKANEGSAEPEFVSAPADDVDERFIDVNSEDMSEANTVMPSESAGNDDVSPELPAGGPSDNVDSEALEAPVDGESLMPEVVHEVVERTTSAEASEGSAEPESVSAPADDVEEKSIEVNSEDTREANTVMPSEESADNEDVSSEPESAEGSGDTVGSEVTLYAPVEEVHEVVESISVPPDDEDKSVEVSSGDVNEATTALDSADNEVGGSGLPAEVSADNVSSEALEPEAVHEVVEPKISAKPDEESTESEHVSAPDHVENRSIEVNSEDSSDAITVLHSERADKEVVISDLPVKNFDQIGETAGASTEAKTDEELTEPASVSAPPQDIKDKSVVTTEAFTESESANKEVFSSVPPAEEPADNVSSGALDAQALHEVVEPTTSEKPVKESAEPESVSAPSDNVEDKSIDLNPEDVTKVTTASGSADNEDVSSEPSAEEPSDNVGSEVTLYAPIEELHEVVEATISAEPNEESAEPESMPVPSDDVEDEFVMVDSRDVAEASAESENTDNDIVNPELPANVSSEAIEPEAVHKVMESTTSAEVDEGSADPEALSAADDLEDISVEVNPEDTCEAVTVLPSESAEDEVVSSELPAEGSADKVDAPVEEIVEIVGTNACPDEVSASLEFVAAPSDDAQCTPKEVEPEVSVPEMEESIMATSIPFPAEEEKSDLEHEHKQSEVSHEGSVENGVESIGVDTVTDTKEIDTADHTSEELLGGATSGDGPEGLSSEEPSDLSLESHEESLSTEDGVALVDRCIQMEEIPQESAAESQRSVSMDGEVNAGNEGIAEGGDIIKDESPETRSVNANRDLSVEDVSHLLQNEMTDEEAAHVATQPVDDVSHLLQAEMTDEEAAHVATQPVDDVSHLLQAEMTDEEAAHVATRPVEDVPHLFQTEMTDEEAAHLATQPVEDVPLLLQTVMTDEEVKLAAAHHPENSVAPGESVEDETPALESDNAHGESLIPPAEASGAPQANEFETVSRELNFNNFSEAPTTSEIVRGSGDESHDAVTSEQVTPYLATTLAIASGEKGSSSDAPASITTQSEMSSPPPVVENEVAPRSYKLDEVATNLHDAAEKVLEDAKSSKIGDEQISVAQSVAQIVLDESSKIGGSSEYISGVVQDVAQLAQEAAQSDPNILPDTVARVFDGETAGANEASQAKETTSLRTMVSLFIVWCVSLCASRISSKDMPAPALKLAAEEVTAVLHSNAPSQPAPSHEAASSNH